MNISIRTGAAAISISCVLASGCGSGGSVKPAGRSTLTTTIGPRTIKATLDGGAFISTKDDTAEIASGAGKIVVEKDRVVQDGREIAKISAGATSVDVDYSNGALTVKADGIQVFPAAAAK